MAMWLMLLLADLLLPAIFWIFGWVFRSCKLPKINYSFGYRTKRSMKNEDTWEFAHRYLGRIWFKMGPIWLVVSVAVMALCYGRDINVIGYVSMAIMLIQVVAMFVSMLPVEKALKETFDENGKRRL